MAQITVLQQGAVGVVDYRCASLPGDPAFEEVHGCHSISFVRRGSFGCDWRGTSLELIPGSLFIGSPDETYRCTHDHHRGGDECLSFQYSADLVDEIAPRASWRIGSIPPLAEMMVLGERAQAAAMNRSDLGLDEIGLLLLEQFAALSDATSARNVRPGAADRRRSIEAALWIEAHAHESLDLGRTASVAGLSSYHFLRMFSAVAGVTPHQYLVRCRLRKAARLLMHESASITDIALEVGFNDVSNFVRTFHRAAGMSPRQLRGKGSNFFQEPPDGCF